eukprot:gene19418-21342_t
MKDSLKLSDLVDLALGSPRHGVVDFNILKTLLHGILSSTKTSDIEIIIAEDLRKSTAENGNDSSAETNNTKEDNDEGLNNRVRPSSVVDEFKEVDDLKGGELSTKDNNVTAFNLIREETKIEDFNSLKFAPGDGNNKAIANLQNELKNFANIQRDVMRRLTIIETECGTLECMPTGEDLLAMAKKDALLKENAMAHVQAERDSKMVTTTDGDRPPVAPLGSERGTSHGDDVTGNSDQQMFKKSWQSFRVNKRLQTVEDGVEKLFSLLDVLAEDQRKMGKLVEGIDEEQKAMKIAKEEEDAKISEEVESEADEPKFDPEEQENKLRELEDKLIRMMGEDNGRTAEEIGRLAAGMSQLGKKFEDFEVAVTKLSEDQEKKGEEDSEMERKRCEAEKNIKEEMEELKRRMKMSLNTLKSLMNGVASKEELEDCVRWPALEDALNVREFKRKNGGSGGDEEQRKEDVRTGGKVTEDNDEEGLGEDVRRDTAVASGDGNGSIEEEEKKPLDISEKNIEEKTAGNAIKSKQHPSEDIKECLRRMSSITLMYDKLQSKVDQIVCDYSKEKSRVDDVSVQQELEDMKGKVMSNLQASEFNKSLIDATKEDVDLLMKKQTELQFPSLGDLDVLKGKVLDLEDKGNETSFAFNDMSNILQNELKSKQQLIDTLYECVEQLQRNKADVTNATSIFDLEAYKNALDTKVSLSEFDEIMSSLENNLQEVVGKIDHHTSEEEALRDALAKISDDMTDKLDTKAGDSLKKYIESRLAELQKSKEDPMTSNANFFSNAAGIRRPLASLFHCISCDRPVYQPGMPLPTISQRFSNRKSKEDKTEFEFRKSYFLNNTSDENNNMATKKDVEVWGFSEPNRIKKFIAENYKREKSIVDLLLGTDGHVYKGRYRKSDSMKKKESLSLDGREIRPRSADLPRPSRITSRHQANDGSSLKQCPQSEPSTPRSLPPLFKSNSLVTTPMGSAVTEAKYNRSETNQYSPVTDDL